MNLPEIILILFLVLLILILYSSYRLGKVIKELEGYDRPKKSRFLGNSDQSDSEQ